LLEIGSIKKNWFTVRILTNNPKLMLDWS